MRKKTVIRIVVAAFGVLFFIGGSYLLFEKGMPLLKEVDKLVLASECDKGVACVGIDLDAPMSPSGIEISRIQGNAHFFTPYAFVIFQQIQYDISMKSTNQDVVQKIFLLIMPSDVNKTGVRNLQYDELKQRFENKGFIDLIKQSDGVYKKQGLWGYGDQVTVKVLIFVEDNNGHTVPIEETNTIFQIQDLSAKTKAIDQHDDKIGNKTILALTWIGVAIAPLLLGIDLIVRAVLKE